MRRARHGVALLEVLLAVSLLGLSMAVSVQTVSTATRTQSRLNEQTAARRVIEEALVELRLASRGGGGPASARGEGVGGALTWSAEIRSANDTTPFRHVSVTVTKKERPIASFRGFI